MAKSRRLSTPPYPLLKARVKSVQAQPYTAQCPAEEDVIDFTPESADYQAQIARRLWPKLGQFVRMRYLYLDGVCKGDGNSRPCRIKHYPIGW